MENGSSMLMAQGGSTDWILGQNSEMDTAEVKHIDPIISHSPHKCCVSIWSTTCLTITISFIPPSKSHSNFQHFPQPPIFISLTHLKCYYSVIVFWRISMKMAPKDKIVPHTLVYLVLFCLLYFIYFFFNFPVAYFSTVKVLNPRKEWFGEGSWLIADGFVFLGCSILHNQAIIFTIWIHRCFSQLHTHQKWSPDNVGNSWEFWSANGKDKCISIEGRHRDLTTEMPSLVNIKKLREIILKKLSSFGCSSGATDFDMAKLAKIKN